MKTNGAAYAAPVYLFFYFCLGGTVPAQSVTIGGQFPSCAIKFHKFGMKSDVSGIDKLQHLEHFAEAGPKTVGLFKEKFAVRLRVNLNSFFANVS
jgi:hypothetical protein